MERLSLVVVSTLVCAAGTVCADVLWDQSQLSATGNSVPNTISGQPPFGLTSYALNDVHVGAGGWTINSVTVYFSAFGTTDWTTAVTHGRLNIFTQTGGLPVSGNVPSTGAAVTLSCASFIFDAGPGFGEQPCFSATAGGLNITLPEGNYWIGLTPVAPGGFFGPEYNWPTANAYGSNTAMWSPYAPDAQTWVSAGVDAAMLIQGTAAPAPGAAALLGLAGIAGFRRRR
jgi:MYXO-CTERM domain-containing protein